MSTISGIEFNHWRATASGHPKETTDFAERLARLLGKAQMLTVKFPSRYISFEPGRVRRTGVRNVVLMKAQQSLQCLDLVQNLGY